MNKNTPKKRNFKEKRNALISVSLVLALLITGIFAFLTATDSKINKFTIGSIDIVLQEYDADGNEWWVEDEDGRPTDELTPEVDANDNNIVDQLENIIPGQVIDKSPIATNVGNNEEWTFISIGIPTADKDDIIQGENSNGKVTIEGRLDDIPIKAYAVQTNFTDEETETAEGVWAKYVGTNSEDEIDYTNMFGEQVADEELADRVQIFKLWYDSAEGFNDTDWTLIDTYKSSDGNNYYIFSLNELLPADDDASTEDIIEDNTPVLVDGFKLIETIGEAITDSLSVWYYTDIPSNDPNSPGVESASDDLSKPAPEIPGKVLIHTENKLIGETLQDNVSIMQEIGGYASDFYVYDTNTGELTNQVAYTGMPITHDLALVQVSKLSANINAPSDLSWLKYGIINQNGELYAALTSCDTSNPAYPTSPIDLFVPNTLTITLTPDGSFVTASCPNATIIANSIDRDSALQKYGTISGTIEVPVKVVAPDSSSLKNVVSGLYLPPNVEKVSWTSTSVLTNVCMPYCKILGDNNGTAGAFYNCTNLTEVQIPSSVEELYPSTFKNCGLTSIVLPKTLKKLDGNVFYGCPLTTVFILSPDSFTCEGGTNFPKTVSYVYYNGSEYNNKIMSNSGTSSHTLVLSENITSIKYATEISNTPELQICYTGSLSELRNIPITSWSYPVGSGTLGDLYDSELVNNNVVLTPNYILSSDEVATING